MLIRFEDLRKVKDKLPHGSMRKIASHFGYDVQKVRNYFGGMDFTHGNYVDAHYEQGGGGVVELTDSKIYEYALQLLNNKKKVPSGTLEEAS